MACLKLKLLRFAHNVKHSLGELQKDQRSEDLLTNVVCAYSAFQNFEVEEGEDAMGEPGLVDLQTWRDNELAKSVAEILKQKDELIKAIKETALGTLQQCVNKMEPIAGGGAKGTSWRSGLPAKGVVTMHALQSAAKTTIGSTEQLKPLKDGLVVLNKDDTLSRPCAGSSCRNETQKERKKESKALPKQEAAGP